MWCQDIALIACASRDFVRDARFLWTIFLSATRSMMPCDICIVFAATALSPAAVAFFTFLTAVRSVDFIVALRLRVTSACLARLRACAELAMELRALSCLNCLSYAQLRSVTSRLSMQFRKDRA